MVKQDIGAKTIAEKILSAHAGRDLRAGDFAICKVDFTFGQDGTSSIIIDRVKELGLNKFASRFCMVIDHSSPSPSEGVLMPVVNGKGKPDKIRDYSRGP